MVLGLEGLEELKDLLADVSLIWRGGVEGVEENDGDGAGILALEVVAIGEKVGGKPARGWRRRRGF